MTRGGDFVLTAGGVSVVSTSQVRAFGSARVLIGAGAWLALALVAGATGFTRAAPPPFPQLVLFGLLAGLSLLSWRSPGFRAWALGVDIRALVVIHATRFVGVYFLVLHARGELPYAFAVPGGWGDIVVATTAVLVAAVSPTRGPVGRGVIALWNALGLADILLVVLTATRLAMTEPASMGALTRLPLSLLPTFLVPIIIWTHVIIFVRLAISRGAGYRPF